MTTQTVARPVYWRGDQPTHCGICQKPLNGTFIDGQTKQGPWGIFDLGCHRMFGTGIGPGKGQMFRRLDNGRWLKVEG